MPKLPRNMVRRTDRAGYFFRQKVAGKTRWIPLGTSYHEALRRLRSLKKQEIPKSGVSVGEAAKHWLASYVPTSRSEKDQRLARRRVEIYLGPHLGHYLLNRLSGEHLRLYRLQLERQKLAPQSVKHILSDLRCLLNWAEDCGVLDRSPFPRRLMPRIQERPPDRLTEEEVGAIVSITEPWGFYVRLALGTGLRWSELCRTQASDVQDGCLVVHRTKSGRVRRVPLSPDLRAEVRGRVGRLCPYSTESSGAFATVVRRLSKVERFHVHQLRHTFACQWLERGGSLAALQEILGHTTIVTTQRYARLSHDFVKREAERVEGRRVPEGVPEEGSGSTEIAAKINSAS